MTTTDAYPVVTGEQIAEIARDVWGSFLALDLEIMHIPTQALQGPLVTGCVTVSGEWSGSIFVECARSHADAAAEAMFAADPGSLTDDEVGDALGELTNMIGGNIKGLLPAPSKLSIPSVAMGDGCHVRTPGASLVDAVTLIGPAGPVHISVWKI